MVLKTELHSESSHLFTPCETFDVSIRMKQSFYKQNLLINLVFDYLVLSVTPVIGRTLLKDGSSLLMSARICLCQS